MFRDIQSSRYLRMLVSGFGVCDAVVRPERERYIEARKHNDRPESDTMPPWHELPQDMQDEAVRPYYEYLVSRERDLRMKRLLDLVGAGTLIVLLGWLFVILPVVIKLDSPGPIFFRQVRVTQFGKEFQIHKFRTMFDRQSASAFQVTVNDDPRITRVGSLMRRYRIDEIGQLIDIMQGNMTFVGTRPEVPEYVREYTPEMKATLLLPAGVTSTASIVFRDEAQLLTSVDDVRRTYIDKILPAKMRYNLDDIRNFSVARDMRIVVETIRAVFWSR
ncbi:sugar transferase [Actinomyces sp.]|uniref:sugar transferase n=1 Tax=Actinomyces sp. TaxID=29317 RepID=UPI0026DC5842|nr:sugar transferase [Actinomyces sp.]MDO4899159.1 sugar transferase [Actinomyces sp.]